MRNVLTFLSSGILALNMMEGGLALRPTHG